MEEKLILDQPDTVTTQGTVEHVVSTTPPVKPLTEDKCCGGSSCGCKQAEKVLINEDPMDGVDILG